MNWYWFWYWFWHIYIIYVYILTHILYIYIFIYNIISWMHWHWMIAGKIVWSARNSHFCLSINSRICVRSLLCNIFVIIFFSSSFCLRFLCRNRNTVFIEKKYMNMFAYTFMHHFSFYVYFYGHRQKWPCLHEWCAQCWIECKINFQILIFWVMAVCIYNLRWHSWLFKCVTNQNCSKVAKYTGKMRNELKRMKH